MSLLTAYLLVLAISTASSKPFNLTQEDQIAVDNDLLTDDVKDSTSSQERVLGSPIKVDDDTMTRPIRKVESQGGSDRIEFDDFELLQYVVGVHSINISYTDQINSITVTYVTAGGLLFSGPLHGKISGTPINITLGPMQHIRMVEGQTSGQFVNQLTFKTVGPGNNMIQYGPYGKEGSTKFSFEKHVIAFHGRSSDSLDSIGIYGLSPLNQSAAKGGSGGSGFNDGLPLRIPPVVGIHTISIWNGNVIDGLQIEFVTLGGGTLMGAQHGKAFSNNMTKITLQEGDHLVAVEGTVDSNGSIIIITQLSFTVQQSTGKLVKYGPFGMVGNVAYNFTGRIVGFHGFAGSQIDKIGVFSVNN